jgi:AbrB family looped-hinge helix DNA binding protein
MYAGEMRTVEVMEQRAKVDSKGQVTIPKAVREALGIKEGDSLLFEVEGSEVRVHAARRPVSFADYAGAWREGKGMGWNEINAYISALRGHGVAKEPDKGGGHGRQNQHRGD